jgi:glycine betaine/choline ABC-type transport system substrate-binding protein
MFRFFPMKPVLCATLAVLALAGGCGRRKQPVMVGSKNDTEDVLVGEMVAQHLERRLDGNVRRQLSLGSTAITHQALLTGQIDLYPEYTGLIASVILKEVPNEDPAILLERTRTQMRRVAQSELFDPLGFDSRATIVVRSSDAPREGSISAAGAGSIKWKIGVTFDFQDRPDGAPALLPYRLPQGAPVRGMDPKQLWMALEKGEVNMIAASATDGHLISSEWKALADDKKVFPAQLAGILVRQEKLTGEPRLKAALEELSGKFTVETMRKLNAQVEIDKKPVAQVAAEALAAAGLR